MSGLTRMLARFGVALAICAMALRIAIPSGYMLGQPSGVNGLPALVICSGQGALEVKNTANPALDDLRRIIGDQDKKDGEKGATQHGCAFAGHSAPVHAPVLQSLAAPAFAPFVQTASTPVHQRPGLGLAAPPPPKTGPPSIV
ncbi:hypothetical protein [Caulobacter segnis]|uniref:hypothetical protein n=1 Tax=Caulobacter segnis TaxID=88688 RepID=UPI0028604B23|nr:hypothetical protein [Caulobacter segnis]MDR6625266.1 hypothetical protein [Caulobacter segnis]